MIMDHVAEEPHDWDLGDWERIWQSWLIFEPVVERDSLLPCNNAHEEEVGVLLRAEHEEHAVRVGLGEVILTGSGLLC